MIDFKKGETKYVSAKVAPKNPHELVVITLAAFELIDKKSNKVIQNGSCDVNNDEISVLLTTDKVGTYLLRMIVRVGAETIIETADIIVSL